MSQARYDAPMSDETADETATAQIRYLDYSAHYHAVSADVHAATDERRRNAAIRRLNSISAEMRKLEAEQAPDTAVTEQERMDAAAAALLQLPRLHMRRANIRRSNPRGGDLMTPEQIQAELMAWRAIALHHAPTATIENAVEHLFTDAQGQLRYIPPQTPAAAPAAAPASQVPAAAPAPPAPAPAVPAAGAPSPPPATHLQAGLAAIAADPVPAAGQPAPALGAPVQVDSPPAAGATLHQLLLQGSTPPAATATAPAEITPQSIASMSQADWLKSRNGVYEALYRR